MRRIVPFAVISALVVLLMPAAPAAAETCEGEHTAEDHRVTDPSDGVELAITVFRSGYADCADTPVILHQHGWAGERTKQLGQDLLIPGDLATFLDAGYSVVSIDARGHGDSGGVASVLHPDDELSGYVAILDYLYNSFPWMLRDPESGVEKDLVVGAYGASYGGGFQTLTAAFDDRLDALIPIVTWHDLVQSLAPNGVPRGAWIDLLYTSGTANAELDPRIDEWAAEVALTGEVPEDAAKHFHEASPISRPGGIDVPALWVQGPPDTLFPLNEGVDNHLDLRTNGVESWLLGVNGGHILPGIQPTGVNAPSRGSLVDWRLDDCVDPVPHAVAFFETFLWGESGAESYMSDFPRAFVPTEQGGCVGSEDWPLADEEIVVEFDTVLSGAELIIPLFDADEDVVLAGVPEFEASVPLGTGGRVFLSLALGDPDEGGWLINDQVTPFETEGEREEQIAIDLAGIATEVPEGATVYLRVETTNEQFVTRAHNTLPEAVLEDVVVRLPVASQGLTDRADAPTPPVRVTAPAAEDDDESEPPPTEEAAMQPVPMPATGGGASLVALLLIGAAVALALRVRS